MTVLLAPGLKVQRQNDGWSKEKVKIYIKERVYLCVCMYDQEVLNGVSFSLCALNFRGVCLNPDPASSSSLSWCCDDGDGTLTDVCSPLCPSLELEAWWGKEKNDMPSQMCHNTTLPHECDFYDTCSKGTWLQSWRLHLAPSFQRNVSTCSGKLKWNHCHRGYQWINMLITHQPTNFFCFHFHLANAPPYLQNTFMYVSAWCSSKIRKHERGAVSIQSQTNKCEGN